MSKGWIRDLVGFCIRIFGIHLFFIKLICRNKATIVLYHDPEPKRFRQHIEFLAKHYNFISLDTLVAALQTRNWAEIPVNALVVTLDDGHKGNYDLLQTFAHYKMKPTIYLCSHIINTGRHFWWKTGISDLNGLKELPFEKLSHRLRAEVDFEFEKEYPDRQALTKSELIEMQPWVDYGSHTKFHPMLTRCTTEHSRDEIESSKTSLEQMLNRTIVHFCYPNGDYGEREIGELKKAGYLSARTLAWGWNGQDSDPYRLKVIEFLDNASIYELCATICGVFALIRKLRLWILRNKRSKVI